jgi:hypothetical protein
MIAGSLVSATRSPLQARALRHYPGSYLAHAAAGLNPGPVLSFSLPYPPPVRSLAAHEYARRPHVRRLPTRAARLLSGSLPPARSLPPPARSFADDCTRSQPPSGDRHGPRSHRARLRARSAVAGSVAAVPSPLLRPPSAFSIRLGSSHTTFVTHNIS